MDHEPKRPATILDVAAQAKVSHSTASRVLNDDPTVNAKLARRVHAAADALGYIPNLAARALRTRQDVVAFLASDIGTEAVVQMSAGMEAAAVPRGVVVTVTSAGGEPAVQLAALSALCELRPRAVVLTGAWIAAENIQAELAEILERFQDDGGRVVVIGAPTNGSSAVSFDDRDAARTLAEHALQDEPSSVLILAGGADHHAFIDRTRGFLDVLERKGTVNVRVVHSPVSRQDAFQLVSDVLTHEPPNLILAGNDRMALGAMRAVVDAGLSVPKDIAVAGIDGIAVGRLTLPTLTTMQLPFRLAGEDAIRLALEPAGKAAEHVVFRSELVRRDSTR